MSKSSSQSHLAALRCLPRVGLKLTWLALAFMLIALTAFAAPALAVHRSFRSDLEKQPWTPNPWYGTKGTFFADVMGADTGKADGKADAIIVNDYRVTLGAASTTSGTAPAVTSARVLVRFSSSNYFTYSNTLVIRSDRTSFLTYDRGLAFSRKSGTRRFRLAAPAFDRVRQFLSAAGFSTLRSSYPSPIRVDVPAYSIAYRGRNVTTNEEAVQRGVVPRRLVRLIRLLEEIAVSRGPR